MSDHFTTLRSKGLILEIIHLLIGPVIVGNLVKIHIDQLTVTDLGEKLTL